MRIYCGAFYPAFVGRYVSRLVVSLGQYRIHLIVAFPCCVCSAYALISPLTTSCAHPYSSKFVQIPRLDSCRMKIRLWASSGANHVFGRLRGPIVRVWGNQINDHIAVAFSPGLLRGFHSNRQLTRSEGHKLLPHEGHGESSGAMAARAQLFGKHDFTSGGRRSGSK